MIKKICTRTTTTDPIDDLPSQLFARMDNEATLKLIVPKVPWRTIHKFRAINSTWRAALRNGLIYDARVQSQATEKAFLAVCKFSNYTDPETYKLYLHSLSEDCWYKLPPIPGYSSGIPYNCQCVPLNGKVYVMGGRKHPSDKHDIAEVYVLDLAGQVSQWEQCKSMQVPRSSFGVGVMDGMIFVFWGESGGRTIDICEKYDPKVDVWYETQPWSSVRYTFADSNLYAMGKEVVRFGRDVDQAFEELHLFAGMLPRDLERDDEGAGLSINDKEDPSDAEETEEPFISEDDSSDETWIKQIDPDLFGDDDLGNLHWFLEDVQFKHGFHEIIEEQGVLNFDEEIQIEREERWDDLRDVTSYLAYNTCGDNWREVETVSKSDLNKICMQARPLRAPCHFVWEIRHNPYSYVDTDLWPLDL